MSNSSDKVPLRPEQGEAIRVASLGGDLLTNPADVRAAFGNPRRVSDRGPTASPTEQARPPEETRLIHEGTAANQAGNFKEAEQTFKKLLAFQEKEYGKQSPEVALTYARLGSTAENDHRWADAQKYFKQQAETAKVAYKDNGPENLMVAGATAGIARMDARQGHLEDAAKNYREAIRMFENAKPATLPDPALTGVIRTYRDYAHLLAVQGDYAASDAAFVKADVLTEILKARGGGERKNNDA
jgi:tetratricopeptide (TPR) repeat protein